MGKFKKILAAIKDGTIVEKVRIKLLSFNHKLTDENFIRRKYKLIFKRELNLENPKTFNEKIQWLKLYDRKEIYTTMVDKYEVKKYVSNIIGEEFIIKTIGVWDNFDEIDFSTLPNRFVLKCTHDSGGVFICKDKNVVDYKKAKKFISNRLKKNFYFQEREWPYKNVPPRIIAEEYKEDEELKELRDYKFFCFNGKVKFFKIDFDRHINHRANYYDVHGNLLNIGEKMCPPDFKKELMMPSKLMDMIKKAEMLSTNFKFLRVDFYEVNNKIYFGELTFYPMSGFGKFTEDAADYSLGELINLDEGKY